MQRSGTTANISISGYVGSGTHTIEARWNGGAWTAIATNVSGNYSGTLTAQPQGHGAVDVRWQDHPSDIITVASFGIGDVFLIGGQSNAVGQFVNNQPYSGTAGYFSLFGNDYQWHAGADPTDDPTNQVDVVSKDTMYGGSYWPRLATNIVARTGVPVAFIPCALSGTAIAQWQPGVSHTDRTTLYGSMIYRAEQVGGVKALLWHQGEADAVAGQTTTYYETELTALANAVFADLGVPTIPAKLYTMGGIPQANTDAINAAIGAEWGTGHILTGPDLTAITTEPFDPYHATQDSQAITVANDWSTVLFTDFGW